MNKISYLIMLLCIYASLFVGCFSLLTYYNGVYLLKNPVYQLFSGIAVLIIAVVLIIVQFVFRKSDNVFDTEEEDEEFLTEEESDNENYDFADSKEVEIVKINDDDIIIVEEKKPDNEVKVLYNVKQEETEENQIIEEKTDNSLLLEKLQGEIKPEENEVHLEKISKDILNEKSEPLSDLTDTQLLYIEKSESSYLNTQGFPQLVITDEVKSKDVVIANQIYKEIEKQNVIKQQKSDKEDLEYFKEEKEENTIYALSITIAILIILNFFLLVYYYFTRM
ncbi:MAG: hypothetical protein ACOX1F_04495 [Erysipelotrichaceae bacterium]